MKFSNRELQLFVDNIKPAIIVTMNEWEKYKHILSQYPNKQSPSGDMIISHTSCDFSRESLGIELGYYPKSVVEFNSKQGKPRNDMFLSTFISYGGIFFNCYESFDDALEWCNIKYKNKMLYHYGRVVVSKTVIEFSKIPDSSRYSSKLIDKKTFTLLR